MRYLALATDYDGTIAHDGRVSDTCRAALEKLRSSGRQLILVTGRELAELKQVFPSLDIFDRVVAENGALLYRPGTNTERLLAEPLPEQFVRLLKQRGVAPISVGRAIVATWAPHETTVIEAIRDLGLELQVIFNKGAVMVLPSGVNKATGLHAALRELELSPHNAVAVGDAENDHALFSLCECSAAVANALPQVKERADIALTRDHGDGVIDLIDQMLADDLKSAEPRLQRHHIEIGYFSDGLKLRIAPYCQNILIAGPAGSGKARLAAEILERFAANEYQICILDAAEKYVDLKETIVIGDAAQIPTVRALLEVFKSPTRCAVVSLRGVDPRQRSQLSTQFLVALFELRKRLGRPHWIVIDEAQHVLASSLAPEHLAPLKPGGAVLLIADQPQRISRAALEKIDLVLALGPDPADTLAQIAAAVGQAAPRFTPIDNGLAPPLAWLRTASTVAIPFQPILHGTTQPRPPGAAS
jgi:HAD superfamily hydrolase (TIGR01484 family)